MGNRPGLLVVGTDTAVGKTSFSEGLLRLSHRRGFCLVPFKPVETGCNPHPQDATRLLAAANIPSLSPADVCGLALPDPVAPARAARLAGTSVDLDALQRQASLLRRRGEGLLVEAAGGLLTPYSGGFTSLDLAELFDIDVLLISPNRLGTISQTALALAELSRRPVRLAGWVLTHPTAQTSPDQPYNAADITALTGRPPLGQISYHAQPTADVLADAVLAGVRLDHLLDGRLS